MTSNNSDYEHEAAAEIPETFIDVKTGESHPVSQKVRDQIEYHSQNSTLTHLVLSALTSYIHPKRLNGGTEEIIFELSELKRMLQQTPSFINRSTILNHQNEQPFASKHLNLKELEEVLDAFGG